MNRSLSIFLACVCLCLFSLDAYAQSDVRRVEVGGQASIINTSLNSTRDSRETFGGFGGRVTINLTNAVSLEGQVDYYPKDISDRTIAANETRQVKPDVTGLFGIKAGILGERFGVFGKLRPGFVRFSPVQDCSSVNDCQDVKTTGFALDVGGVVEGYVSSRVMVRLDIEDTYLRLRETQFLVADLGITVLDTREAEGRHGLQFSFGVGFRF